LKILDTVMPILSRIDRFWPWKGLSVIGIGVKVAAPPTSTSFERQSVRSKNLRSNR
jgi:hypothetical protein